MRTTKVGTRTYVEAKISPDEKVVAIVDAIGNGSVFLRVRIDGGWYYSPLEWECCQNRRVVYPALVGVYKHLRRKHITQQSLRHLVRLRAGRLLN
jgi:hypothetical protein